MRKTLAEQIKNVYIANVGVRSAWVARSEQNLRLGVTPLGTQRRRYGSVYNRRKIPKRIANLEFNPHPVTGAPVMRNRAMRGT
jgi:hypothetical protein